jgi:hypothetical protein
MKNNDIMGFQTSPKPSRKTLRGNRDNIIIHDQEISDMRASLKRLIDQIQNEAKLSGQKDPKAFAELSLAEQLNVEVRTLRKFIDDDSREIHLNTFNKLRDGLLGVTLPRVNDGGQLANFIFDTNIDGLVIRYAYPRNDSLSQHEGPITSGIQFINDKFDLEIENSSSDLLAEIKAKTKLESDANKKIKELKEQNTYFYAAKIPTFNRPKKDLFVKANYILVFSGNKKDELPEIITDVPWANIKYKKEFKKNNLDKIES